MAPWGRQKSDGITGETLYRVGGHFLPTHHFIAMKKGVGKKFKGQGQGWVLPGMVSERGRTVSRDVIVLGGEEKEAAARPCSLECHVSIRMHCIMHNDDVALPQRSLGAGAAGNPYDESS